MHATHTISNPGYDDPVQDVRLQLRLPRLAGSTVQLLF